MFDSVRPLRSRRPNNSPKFIVNSLFDAHVLMNSKMAQDLATFILNTELHENEGHLFAFAKQLEKARFNIESHLARVQQDINEVDSEGDSEEEFVDDNYPRQ